MLEELEEVLMDEGYFDLVQRAMVRAGFVLISRVEINKSELPPNGFSLYERVTSLFFHVLGKAIIIKLAYNEGGELKGLGFWTMSIYMQCRPMDSYTWANLGDILGIKTPEFTPRFGYQSGELATDDGDHLYLHRIAEPDWRGPIDPKIIAAASSSAASRLTGVASSERFRKLPINDFPPSILAMGDCSELFWDRWKESSHGWLEAVLITRRCHT